MPGIPSYFNPAMFGAGAGRGSGTYTSTGSTGARGPYGQPVGQIGMPNPRADLASVYPNLSALTGQTSNVVGSELAGTVSQNTMNALGTEAAQRGVSSGMPGLAPGSLGSNDLFANIAGYSENRQRQGLQDYLASTAGISKTQTVDPALQTEINLQNAVSAAAPDPTMAAEKEQALFQKYFNETRGPQGGTSNVPWYNRGASNYSTTTRIPYGYGAQNNWAG